MDFRDGLEPDLGGWKFGEMHSMTLRIPGVTPDKGIAPTGTVTFSADNAVLGTVPVTDGAARWSTDRWATGAHSITAVYGGDGNFPSVTTTSQTLVNRLVPGFSASMQGNSIKVVVAGVALGAPSGVLAAGERSSPCQRNHVAIGRNARGSVHHDQHAAGGRTALIPARLLG